MKNALIILLLLSALLVSAQNEKPVSEYLPTENLEMKKDANKASNRPDRKKILLLYVPDASKILYGNACATEATHKMGFEYIVEPRKTYGSKTATGKFLNNLGVKSKLVVTRSPFWKIILNKRIKECRKQSGDFVG